nr:MAG TPA: hypothetical protein [Caudoviricetes sp.]
MILSSRLIFSSFFKKTYKNVKFSILSVDKRKIFYYTILVS